MGIILLDRVPEPEVMAEEDEAEAYASAAAAAYLDKLDNAFVEFVIKRFARQMELRSLLDVGTGPGQIPVKIARRLPAVEITGVDLSEAMVRRARQAAERAGLEKRLSFELADAKRLPYPDRSFDLVISNSLLHHLSDPVPALDEMARVSRGPVFIRDLRRPSRLTFRLHVDLFGRHYSGLMRKLFEDSVRAAYTWRELRRLVKRSRLAGAMVRPHKLTYLIVMRGG